MLTKLDTEREEIRENFDRVRKYKKEPSTFGEHNNWNENYIEGISIRIANREECISDLENRWVEITQSEQKKK